MIEVKPQEAKRCYQYIGRIETIFNVFANALEEANAGIQNIVNQQIKPLFTDPSKVSFDVKLIHIQDMDNFNKTAGWIKNPITFAVDPNELPPSGGAPDLKVEERPPPDEDKMEQYALDILRNSKKYRITKLKPKE